MHWTDLQFEMALDPRCVGTVAAECAHCTKPQVLARHRIMGRMIGAIPIPSGEALICPECHKASRQEGLISRVFGVLFLIPALVVTGCGVGAGLYMIWSMLEAGESPLGYLLPPALLSIGSGVVSWRILLGMQRLLQPRKLLKLEHLQTSL